tara:strand:+ start:191 stop:508 length:318 start_codon:yes stop_codon:yes gene_type:complete
MTTAIIGGKRYNSDTSQRVGEEGNGLPINDFHHWGEYLYLTPKGAWWLHGFGGGATGYSEEAWGGGSTSGDRFRALTPDEAYEWLEKYRYEDKLEEHFSDKLEDA